MPRDLIPVAIVFIVIGIPVICGTLLALAGIVRGDGKKGKKNATNPSEVEALQEMQHILHRLEDRIESLETIVLTNEKRRRKSEL